MLIGALVAYLALPFDLPSFLFSASSTRAIIVGLVLRTILRGDAVLVHEHWPGPPASLAVVLRLAG